MINQQLISFIRFQLQQGTIKEKITADLISNGWTVKDVEEGFEAITKGASETTSSPVKIKKHIVRNLFLIVIVLALISGGAYAYYFKDDVENLPFVQDFLKSNLLKQIPYVKDLVKNNDVVVLQDEVETPEMAVVQDTQVLPEEIKPVDCGTAGPIVFGSNKKISADDTTIKAWECFTNNLKSCTVSKLILKNKTDMSEVNVVNKKSEGCEISAPKVDSKTKKVSMLNCLLSQKMVDYSFNQSEKLYPGQEFFKGYSTTQVVNIAGQEFKFPDGTKETLICK